MKRYRVTLTAVERQELVALTKKDATGAKKFVHARILLLADANQPEGGWTTAVIANALGISGRAVEHTKQRFIEESLEAALGRRVRAVPPRAAVFDGEKEARLIALACSPAPAGRTRWTVRLLAEQLVVLDIFPAVSPATVHRTLKKMNLSLT
jgi:hypothetical protein